MALTADQNIPEKKPAASEPWTFKRLFPFKGAALNLTQTFRNPLEVLLGYVVFVIGIAVLFHQPVPSLFYGLCGLLFGAVYYERLLRPIPPPEVKEPKKEKK